MNFVKVFSLLFLMLELTACSYISSQKIIQNRDNHYLTAESIPPLRVPPGVSTNDFRNYYPVSDRNYPGSSEKISVVPPGLMN